MKTCLIDADSLIYINCYSKKDEPVKTLQDCKDSVDDMIAQILKATKSSHYLLFLTVGKGYRYKIYPEYKANRKYGERPEFFSALKEYLISDYKALYNTELEADDLC